MKTNMLLTLNFKDKFDALYAKFNILSITLIYVEKNQASKKNNLPNDYKIKIVVI